MKLNQQTYHYKQLKYSFTKNTKIFYSINFTIVLIFFFVTQSFGQFTLSGKINTIDKNILTDATISIPKLGKNTITNELGIFSIEGLPNQQIELLIRHVGYQTIQKTVFIRKDTYIEFTLYPKNYILEEITIADSIGSNYRVSDAQVGPLGKISVKDIPYSFNVTSSDLIENRGSHTMADALKTNPAVAVLMSSNTYSSMSRMMIRGFNAADQSELRDGLTDRSFSYVPIENVERIEVMNGLSGFLYGFSAIGGTVNYVSKKPTMFPLASLSIGQYGGGVNYIHADLGGRADKSGKMGFRFNAYKEGGSTYIEGSEQSRTFMSGVLDYEIFPGTKLTADIYHHSLDMDGLQTYFALPSSIESVPAAFDPTKQYGQSWSFNQAQKTLIGISINSDINENLSIRAAHRFGDMWRSNAYVSASLLDIAGNYEETYNTSPTQLETTHSSYLLADLSFHTFGIQHQITLGYTGTSFYYERGVNVSDSLGISNVAEPTEYDVPSYPAGLTTYLEQHMDNFLIGNRMTFTKSWSLLIGLNYASISQDAGGINTGISTSNFNQHQVTPSIALTFKPLKETSIYLSYMQGLSTGGTAPTTAANALDILSPAVSDQYELGVKSTFSKIDITAALFDINKVNEYVDPTDNVYKQDGREVHKGFELTVNGKLIEGLNIVGGFTLMDAKMTRTANNPEIEGKTPINVPEEQVRLYLEYALPFVDQIVISTGANYFGKRPIDNLNELYLPSITTNDFGLRYHQKILKHNASFIFNLSNFLNKHYWINYRSGDGLQLGTPRVWSLSIKYNL
ncbi:TonB-dependent receptor [Chondrinema litorale]|uniref:TonB-dependent receptor n=1 Tax=Chondrinema litorale TaxID=2994555 RepID=UPI00254312C8|nr:TonB-dependent receptor [Chondrinema litorale]UZR96577.1 TonB-dependent receptor [Chondrinema litorale]